MSTTLAPLRDVVANALTEFIVVPDPDGARLGRRISAQLFVRRGGLSSALVEGHRQQRDPGRLSRPPPTCATLVVQVETDGVQPVPQRLDARPRVLQPERPGDVDALGVAALNRWRRRD
jgi:hypothetical protein